MDLTEWDKALLALIGTMLSGVRAYRFGRRRAEEDRAQRAKEIATALLIELRYTEGWLRNIYSEEQPLHFKWYTPLPWFEKLFPEVRCLSPLTMRAAYEFYGLVLEVRARIDMFEGVQQLAVGDHYALRVKAGFAVERLHHLVERLAADGGVLPPALGVKQVSHGQLPPLPPVLFPEALGGEEVGHVEIRPPDA